MATLVFFKLERMKLSFFFAFFRSQECSPAITFNHVRNPEDRSACWRRRAYKDARRGNLLDKLNSECIGKEAQRLALYSGMTLLMIM